MNILPEEISSMRGMNKSPERDTDWGVSREFQMPKIDLSNWEYVVDSSFFSVPNDKQNSTILYEKSSEHLTGVYLSENEGLPKHPVSRAVKPPELSESDLSLQKWEGQVLEVFTNSFTARLADITAKGAKEDAEFPLSVVADDDISLLEPGAIFYWVIGRRYDTTNRPSIASELRFRRLPDWSEDEIANASLKAQELAAKFGIE